MTKDKHVPPFEDIRYQTTENESLVYKSLRSLQPYTLSSTHDIDQTNGVNEHKRMVYSASRCL